MDISANVPNTPQVPQTGARSNHISKTNPFQPLPLKNPESAKVPYHSAAQTSQLSSSVRNSEEIRPITLIYDSFLALVSVTIFLLFYTQL